MECQLYRWSPKPSYTLGTLHLGDFRCHTLERPWLPDPRWPGGTKSQSCVPDGQYALEPFTRPNGDKVYRMVNPLLGVYRTEEEIPAGVVARSYILIHIANYIHQIIGCIGPGKTQWYHETHGQSVGSSGAAMAEIVKLLDRSPLNSLEIVTL